MGGNRQTGSNVVSFNKRNAPLRVCLVENKRHVCAFLADMIEPFGFVVRGCTGAELESAMLEINPDLILLGALSGREELMMRLRHLKSANYNGRVMLFGGRWSPDLMECQDAGERIGLRMLPFLAAPFRDSELADNLSPLRPMTKPETVDVDIDEALDKGWLELRYQPKIDVRNYSVAGAEAFVFIRHPVYGVSLPDASGFTGREKTVRAVMEFTVARAREDWSILTAGRSGPLLSVGIPLPILEDSGFVDWLCQRLGRSSRSGPIAVAISGAEAAGNFDRLRRVARMLNDHGVGTLLDRVGVEILGLLNHKDGGFAELKADQTVANGCADDDAKRIACARLVQVARACGARAAAAGVRTRADFRKLCELGFDLIQGALLAPPMETRKLMRLLRLLVRVPA